MPVRMAIGRPKSVLRRTIVGLTPELAAAIDDYRFSRRIGTESEALRQLIELGLEAAGKAKPRKGRERVA
jgi:hypothetical protein